MIFLGVEQAPQKIQFANTNYRHFAIKTAICRVAKRGFFRLFANGKTFAPSASEVKAHGLRGLNYYPLIKVFCELFFKKAKIFT